MSGLVFISLVNPLSLKIRTTFFEIASMKSERELESVGTTTIPRLDSNASGIVLIVFLTKYDLTA